MPYRLKSQLENINFLKFFFIPPLQYDTLQPHITHIENAITTTTHKIHTLQSGAPPMAKWDTAPVKAVNVMINILVPTAVFSS